MWFLFIIFLLTIFVIYTYKLAFFFVVSLYVALVFYVGVVCSTIDDDDDKKEKD